MSNRILLLGLMATAAFVSPVLAQGDAPELTEATSRAINKGLAFLLAAQNADGSWDSDGEGGRSVGITSLALMALMAFMGKAQFPGSGPHAKELDRGMKWLLKQAESRPDGYLGSIMYEHGLATLALFEMWGMTRDPDDAIHTALEKAVDVILRSQNPGGGWHYQPQADGGEDSSCTPQTVFHMRSPPPAKPASWCPTKPSARW